MEPSALTTWAKLHRPLPEGYVHTSVAHRFYGVPLAFVYDAGNHLGTPNLMWGMERHAARQSTC